MSIHQPIQLPVQEFSSEDANAPQISVAGAAGEIKTVLKACLSTGYGTKAAATDWGMIFEDGNKAVFKSTSVYSKQFPLKIDNSTPKGGQISCYESMSDVNTGANSWSNTDAGLISRLGGVTAVSWKLFATPVAFLLIIENIMTSGAIQPLCLLFGDFMSVLPADTGNVVCYHARGTNGGNPTVCRGIVYAYAPYESLRIAHSHNATSGGISSSGHSTGTSIPANNNIAGATFAYPLYLREAGGDIRLIMPFQIGDKKINLTASYQTIAGRRYYVTNFSMPSHQSVRTVVYIPMDYWSI